MPASVVVVGRSGGVIEGSPLRSGRRGQAAGASASKLPRARTGHRKRSAPFGPSRGRIGRVLLRFRRPSRAAARGTPRSTAASGRRARARPGARRPAGARPPRRPRPRRARRRRRRGRSPPRPARCRRRAGRRRRRRRSRGGSSPVADRLEEDRAAVGLAVVVDGVRVGQEAEAGGDGRARHARSSPGLEPAHRAGGDPAQDDPAIPRLAQDRVEPVRAPDRQQVEQRAAADVDHVLAEQAVAEVQRLRAQAEERDGVGLARLVAEARGRSAGSGSSGSPLAVGSRQTSDAARARRRARRRRARGRPAPARSRRRPSPRSAAGRRSCHRRDLRHGLDGAAEVVGGQRQALGRRRRRRSCGRPSPRGATRPPGPGARLRSAAPRRPRRRSPRTRRR